MNIYKYAAQHAIRFASNRGMLTVEQLFDLPLKSDSGFCLDNVAKAISAGLKSLDSESFVEEVKPDSNKNDLQVAFEIVKDVIATKKAANEAVRLRQENAARKHRILELINEKKDAKFKELTIDELEKELASVS